MGIHGKCRNVWVIWENNILFEGVYGHLDDLYVCVCNDIGLLVRGPI